jgi:hypothetical protein
MYTTTYNGGLLSELPESDDFSRRSALVLLRWGRGGLASLLLGFNGQLGHVETVDQVPDLRGFHDKGRQEPLNLFFLAQDLLVVQGFGIDG